MNDDARKLRSVEEMARLAEQHRTSGQRVIFTSGCFDLLHVGHVRSLRAARGLGDVLVIGLNSDASVRGLKGDDRPYFPEHERAAVLSELECVDHIVIVEDLTMDRVLERLRPHVFAKGTDYTVDTIPERETVRAYGGELAIVGDPKTRGSRQFKMVR